uniref:(northern house mosquito) hypothetical protein n=1 Tax=Culex pipiens TaxID=7175 RepID=A0A8D8MX37_CULPI
MKYTSTGSRIQHDNRLMRTGCLRLRNKTGNLLGRSRTVSNATNVCTQIKGRCLGQTGRCLVHRQGRSSSMLTSRKTRITGCVLRVGGEGTLRRARTVQRKKPNVYSASALDTLRSGAQRDHRKVGCCQRKFGWWKRARRLTILSAKRTISVLSWARTFFVSRSAELKFRWRSTRELQQT